LKGQKNYTQKINLSLMTVSLKNSVFSDTEIDGRQDGRAFN